jgi:glutamate 5-kinase
MSDIFSGAKLVVVKVGSALLVDGGKGELRREWLTSLCADVAALKRQGVKVVLVSSGSIALGRRLLKLAPGVLRLEEARLRPPPVRCGWRKPMPTCSPRWISSRRRCC